MRHAQVVAETFGQYAVLCIAAELGSRGEAWTMLASVMFVAVILWAWWEGRRSMRRSVQR